MNPAPRLALVPFRRVAPLTLTLLGFIVANSACVVDDDGFARAALDVPDATSDEELLPTIDESGDTCPLELAGGELNVIESYSDGPEDWWTCSLIPDADAPECACIDGYLDLAGRTEGQVQAIGESGLDEELRAIDADLDGQPDDPSAVLSEAMAAEQLTQELIAATGTCFLRLGLDERELRVTVSTTTQRDGYEERELIFEDPWIGRFGALLLVPDGEGPFPAIVALHGHGDDARYFASEYHGDWFPGRGYAILVPTLRGMCVDEAEDSATRALLMSGTSLLGVRSYEAALAAKYLRWLPEIDGSRLGLMGHSTGSAAGNVAVRMALPFAAYVTDLKVNYYAYIDRPLVADVMAPRVYPYHQLINDLDTAPIPMIEVGYGYGTANEDDPQQPNELPGIFSFFDAALDVH